MVFKIKKKCFSLKVLCANFFTTINNNKTLTNVFFNFKNQDFYQKHKTKNLKFLWFLKSKKTQKLTKHLFHP